MNKLDRPMITTIILYLLIIVALVILKVFNVINEISVSLIVLALSIYIFASYLIKTRNRDLKRNENIEKALNKDSSYAFKYGNIGLVTYDDQFDITWMSSFFKERNIDFVGKKATKWVPEIYQIFQGDVDELKIAYGKYYFKITRNPEDQMLFVVDETDKRKLEIEKEDEEVVLGLIHYDNYEEATRYEEETVVSVIDSEVKTPVMNWASAHNIIIKRLKRDRYLLVLNQKIYRELVQENFVICDEIREATKSYQIPITLSMAFAYGSGNYEELDNMLYDLLELAQGRGGDQVAMRKYGEDPRFFGGNTEAQENRNKLRVKVIAKSLRELAYDSNKVIIVGHKEADFDCMGACLGLSELVKSFNKEAYIVYDEDNLEASLLATMHKYEDKLFEHHNFISEERGLSMLDNDTLVIMADHHDLTQTMAESIITTAKKIAVVDHHRRKGDFTFDPTMVYLEPGASSVSELVTELILSQNDNKGLTEEEATIMYTGILIDTNNFKVRVGSRTFEAAANLRKYGADPMESFELLKEDFSSFEIKSHVLNNCEKYDNGIIIATYDERPLTRALMSQVANDLLEIKGVNASFVIGKLSDNVCAISARSNGEINVQVILERMHGGGHFSQAGLQRENTTVKMLKDELIDNI